MLERASISIDTVNEELQAELLTSPKGSKFNVKYNVLEVVGQGSTGVVYRARHRENGRQVALKTLRTDDHEMIRVAEAEFALLRLIEHPNIIRAFDFFIASDRVVLVLEFFEGQSLDKATSSLPERCLSERVAHAVFTPLLQAVGYLHQRRIIHRDVKAQNVLVSNDFKDLRLVDFNTAKRLCEGGALTLTGTRLYAAPEVLLGDSPSEGSDVWAAGLCLHLILCGRLPVQLRRAVANYSEFVRQVTEKPFELCGRSWQTISEPCKATLMRCLELKKELRPAAMTLLEDDWMRNGPESRNGCGQLRCNGASCRKVERRVSYPSLAVAALQCRSVQRTRAKSSPPTITLPAAQCS